MVTFKTSSITLFKDIEKKYIFIHIVFITFCHCEFRMAECDIDEKNANLDGPDGFSYFSDFLKYHLDEISNHFAKKMHF